MHSTVTSNNVSGFTLAGPPCRSRRASAFMSKKSPIRAEGEDDRAESFLSLALITRDLFAVDNLFRYSYERKMLLILKP